MVKGLFLQVLNMSFTASIVILAVLLLRLPLKRAPKVFSFALWGAVLFRLLCPFSLESVVSLLPRTQPFPKEMVWMEQPVSDTVITVTGGTAGPAFSPSVSAASADPLQILLWAGALLWLMGMAILAGYSLFSLLRLRRKLKSAAYWQDNVWLCDGVDTAFVLGVFRPRIYLPVGLREEEQRCILLHERTHLKRLDHLTRLAAFAALCLHWFNPLVWVAFYLSGRDMEMSCDEAVIKALGTGSKKTYSSSLLTLAVGRRFIPGAPLAFGEGDTKGRVKNVLGYRKPAFWLTLLAAVVIVAAAAALMTDPAEKTPSSDTLQVQGIILEVDPEHNTMMVEGTEPNSPIGDQCVVTWEGEPFFRMDEQGKRQSLTAEDFSVGDRIAMETGPIQESYPTSTTAFSIELLPSQQETMARSLWEARVPYIGSAPDVGRLVGLLGVPEGLEYDYFQLQTSQEPYGVTIFYQGTPGAISRYEAPEEQSIFQRYALILLALVDNGNQVTFVLEGGEQPLTLSYSSQWAQEVTGSDIHAYSESSRTILELLELPLSASSASESQEGSGGNVYSVVFPAYDQRTEFNGAIFDIQPFQLRIRLPEGFTIAPKGEGDLAYPLMGAWTPLGIYDETGAYVGAVGYNLCEETPGAENLPQAIYNQVALGNNYQFSAQPKADGRGEYEPVRQWQQGETAVTKVYTAPQLAQELGLGNNSMENLGILSYDRQLGVYIAIELDSGKISQQQLVEMASSVQLLEGDGETS